jgi:hypothetical protein
VQARGIYNRMPDRQEATMLKDWAYQQGLTCDIY